MYEINKAAVIGAGTMGLGIAGQLANAGVDVLLLDIASEGDNRNAIAERALERLLDENQPGLLHKDFIERISIGNIEDDMGLLADRDWIAEAVVERLDIKRALYREIDAVRKAGSIVSSNTSTIPISLLVEEMPESFRAEFASHSALLHSTKGTLAGGWGAFVHANGPRFQRFGDPPGSSQVAREHVCGQSVTCVVGTANCFVFLVEGNNRRQRCKRLFVHAFGLLRRVY